MKIKRISILFLSCLLIVISSFGSFAAVHSSSNAVMALSLDDDSGIALYSSVGTATNTVNWDGARVLIGVRDTVLDIQNNVLLNVTDFSSTGMSFSYSLDGTAWNDPKYIIDKITFVLYKDSLPNVGSYLFSWDVASQFSYSIYSPNIWTYKDNTNASRQTKTIPITDYESSSGDFAVLGMGLQLTNITSFQPNFWISQSDRVRNIDLSCRIGFVPSSGDYSSTAGSDTSVQDYQSEISSSISDIGSSLESVDENLQYISSSQNLIIQGIDNLILHISDQLYALWDQMYNLMHVPTMAKLDEIISAIQNINLDVTVDLDELKSSITQNAESIKNGYDNSGLTFDNDRLDSSIQEYDEVENQVLDPAKTHLENFQFNNDLNEVLGPITDISYFLQGIFTGMGSMNIAVSFSLTLTIALLLIGWYRFKGGS